MHYHQGPRGALRRRAYLLLLLPSLPLPRESKSGHKYIANEGNRERFRSLCSLVSPRLFRWWLRSGQSGTRRGESASLINVPVSSGHRIAGASPDR